MARKKTSVLRSELEELIQEASRLKEEVNNELSKIKSEHIDINSKLSEISDFYTEFQEIKNQLEDEETGIDATVDSVNEVSDQIKEIKKNVEQTKEEIIKNKISTESLLKEVDDLKDEMENTLAESLSYKEDIGKILQLVTDTGLANSFDTRRKNLKRGVFQWTIILFFGILLGATLMVFLFGFNEYIFLINQVENPLLKFIFKITLTSPAVFLIWFSAIQFSKERYLLEQYEFKTATALAMENYTKLIKEKFPGENYEVKRFELMLELIKIVYKEPEYMKHKTKFANKLLEPTTKTGVESLIETEEQ